MFLQTFLSQIYDVLYLNTFKLKYALLKTETLDSAKLRYVNL